MPWYCTKHDMHSIDDVCPECQRIAKKKQLLYWQAEKPTEEGWYFWRKSRKSKYSFRWNAWFVAIEPGGSLEGWLDGTNCHLPNGGWWAGPIAEPESLNDT